MSTLAHRFPTDKDVTRMPQLASRLLQVNLSEELQRLRAESSWQRGTGRSSKTLVKYPDFHVVLVLMKENTRMNKHHVDGRFSIHALQGKIRIRLPEELGVWGIDSGIRHAVSGADYGAVRVGAFMGYRVLAALAGLRVTPGDREGHVRVDDPRWHGYLANVGANGFHRFAPDIPEELEGAAFLADYQGTTDLVTPKGRRLDE